MRSVAVGLAIILSSVAGVAQASRPFLIISQDHTFVEDCEHFHTHNSTSLPSEVHSQEQRAVNVGAHAFTVKNSESGGISVKGWDRPDSRLTVCKYAAAANALDATKLLRGISITVRDGSVTPVGPAAGDGQAWWVHMILNVPRQTALDLSSADGGIAVRNISGRIIAHTRNGAITLGSCAGEHEVETDSGGISLDRISGRTRARTGSGGILLNEADGDVALSSRSGEISVLLDHDRWSGAGLTVSSTVGNLRLRLREPYLAAIEADTADLGEIRCGLSVCEPPSRSAPTHMRIGTAAPSIHLSTKGSPISIERAQ